MKRNLVRDAYAEVCKDMEQVSVLRPVCLEVWEETVQLPALKEFAEFPMLFCSDLGLNNTCALVLSQMYIYLTLFFRVQDCAIDENNTQHNKRLLCGNIFLAQLMKMLGHFPPEVFDIVEKTFLEYSQASFFEISRYSFSKDEPVSLDVLTFDDISFLGKKFSPLKIPLAAAVIYSGNDLLNDVDALFDNYGIALQLRNDMIDWKEDYERGQMTYFLCRLINEFGKESALWPEIRELNRVAVFSPLVEEMIAAELHYVEKARVLSKRISKNLNNFFEKKIESLKEDIQDLKSWKNNYYRHYSSKLETLVFHVP